MNKNKTKISAKNPKQCIDCMRSIFDLSQRVDKHNTCLQEMLKLQTNTIHSNSKHSVEVFYKELIRNVKFTLSMSDSRSPHTYHTITFIIKYLLTFCAPTEDLNDDCDFIESVLNDVVIPYTNNHKPECRINACHFIRRLSEQLDDISADMHKEIRKTLINRCRDRISSVRAAAVVALHRFQDTSDANDLVMEAIKFHLNNDPDYEVRHSCLKSLAVCPNSFKSFIESTRDIKDIIRKTAYMQIADKIGIKCFTIEQRLTILKNGLKDRSPAVRKVVETFLIPSWVKSCNNDLIQLLIALDIQTDIELIEKMLEIYFKQLNHEKVSDDSDETKFHQLVNEFRDNYLTNERIFSVTLNVENVFLWQFLCQFCKTNKIESKNSITIIEMSAENNVSEQQTPEQTSEVEENNAIPVDGEKTPETVAQTVDAFDLLVPDVPYFCHYLLKFINNMISKELPIEDALEFEFIYNQFMKVSLLLDIGDEAQRKIVEKTMHDILIDNQIGDKFHSYIRPIMKCLAKIGFSDNNSYLNFTAEIISEIYEREINSNERLEESISDDSNRELEIKIEKLGLLLNQHKTDLQQLESEGKVSEAQEKSKTINELEEELKNTKESISNNTLSQSSQTSQTKSLPSFANHPKPLMRCLHILSGCLEFGDFNEVNAVMQTHVEKVCLPGIINDDHKLRFVAIRCLGLVCLTSAQYFKQYLTLLIEIFSKDIQTIKIIALQTIFDSLCEHGVNIFEDKSDNSEKSSNASDVLKVGFDNTDEDFMTSLIQFFEQQLESEIFEVKHTTAQGVAKLLINGRLYSPKLLSKLIIIWFTPDESQALIQFLGDFLHLYTIAESQGVIVGQSAIEEAFIMTLEAVYENDSKHINSDNLIKFFLSSIGEESHAKLAFDLVNKIIESDSTQLRLAKEVLLSAVSHLNLIEMETKELKCFEEKVQEIESKFKEYLNSKSKSMEKKVSLIRKKIENRSQQLSADSAFINDFAPIDDDTDMLDPNEGFSDAHNGEQPMDSDSEADSYRTCPESPVHKRRKLTENNSTNDLLSETNDLEKSLNETNLSENVLIEEKNRSTLETINDGIEIQITDEQQIGDPFMEMD